MATQSSVRLDLRAVTLTGGTGGFNLNRGLSELPHERISSIYTICDNGGSAGDLRTELGVLPPGDARRLILAHARGMNDTMETLMGHRFGSKREGSKFNDQSLGNMILAAAEENWGPINGIRRIAHECGAKADIFPISTHDAHLMAELSNGQVVRGETAIDRRSHDDDATIMRVFLDNEAYICKEAHEAIVNAHYIVLGPGDLYTSIIPILLVKGVAEAIAESKAKLFFIASLMTKFVETHEFEIADLVELLMRYGVGRDKFDAVLVNNGEIPDEVLKYYNQTEKALPFIHKEAHRKRLSKVSKRVLLGNFVSASALRGSQPLIHHDSSAVSRALMGLMSSDGSESEKLFVIDADDTILNTSVDLQGDRKRIQALTIVQGAREFIKTRQQRGHRVILLSAGDPEFQKEKLRTVGLEFFCEELCIVPTPAEKKAALQRIVAESGVTPKQIVVIGDQCDHELLYAKELGCTAIRIQLPMGKYAHQSPLFGFEPDLVASDFDHIGLQRLCA